MTTRTTSLKPSLCLWPQCKVRPRNLPLHMQEAHNVVMKTEQAPKIATAPRQLGPVQVETNFTPDTLLKKSIGHAIQCIACNIAARIIKQDTDRDGNVRRRRECPKCLTRFTTYEIRFADAKA